MKSLMHRHLSLVWIPLFFSTSILGQTGEKLKLEYKFEAGETLRYKTESHDSTSSGRGDQVMNMKMTRWSMHNLSVLEKPSTDKYKVSIEMDTVWTDQDEQQSEGRVMRFRVDPQNDTPDEYQIASNGKSQSEDPVVSPFLLPLPDEPVGINDTWDFEMKIEQRGRMQGETTVTGQCLLYDLYEDDGRKVATIIVNTESKGESTFRFQRPDGDPISGTGQSYGSMTSLVYFDVSRGRIVEIVTEEKRDTAMESSMFSSNTSIMTKSTIHLISK